MKKRLPLLLLPILFLTARHTFAHASLVRSNPPANTVLEEAPPEIRLWFTEPLEASFSHIILLDSSGQVVETEKSQIDSSDAHQQFMTLPPLEDGIYTVAWQALSSADGHTTEGSFPFSIGVELDLSAIQSTLPKDT